MSTGSDWEQERLAAAQKAVEASLSSALLDTGGELWQRFSANLLNTLRQRRFLGETLTNPSMTFVLVERSQAYASEPQASRVRDLDSEVATPLCGRLFIVGENANGGLAFPAATQADVDALLARLGLEHNPTIVVFPATDRLRIYPEGIGNLDYQVPAALPSPGIKFSVAGLIEVITKFHQSGLCIPEKTGSCLWDQQSKWLPYSEAEKKIQWPLLMALSFHFDPDVVVVPEHPTPTGTADFVFFTAVGPRTDPPLAIVETKVQKSFRANGAVSPSETARELIRGLVQTVAYQKATLAGEGILVCFDLRKPAQGSDAAWSSARDRGRRVMKRLNSCAPHVFTWIAFADSQVAQAHQVANLVFSDDPLFPVSKRPDLNAALVSV